VVVSLIPTNEVAFEMGAGMNVSRPNLAEYAVEIPQTIPKQVNNIHSGVHGAVRCINPACVVELSPTAQALLKQYILMGG
jgi:hypothetical protein